MTYGLKVIDDNENTILDSSINGLSGLRIRASGTGTTASVTPGFDSSKELLFINVQPTSGNEQAVVPDFTTSPGTPTFRQTFGTGTVTVNWAIVERFVDAGTVSPEGYGLKVFDANGDLQFNSDLFEGEGGISLSGIRQAFTLIGKPESDGYASLSTDITEYVEVSWGIWGGSGGGYRGVTFVNGITDYHPGGTTTFGQGIYYISDYQNNIFEDRTKPLLNQSAILLAEIGGSV